METFENQDSKLVNLSWAGRVQFAGGKLGASNGREADGERDGERGGRRVVQFICVAHGNEKSHTRFETK